MPFDSNTAHRPTFADAWRFAQAVDGWLTDDQGQALFDAARDVRPGAWIVEIGSHCGRSTLLLAAGKADGVGLLAVDPFDDPRWGGGPDALIRFQDTLRGAGLLDEVESFRGLSAEASEAWTNGLVGMLFVDGAHDRGSVLTDIDGWAPHLAYDAVILLHDAYSSPGVTRAVFERFCGRSGISYVGSTGSLARFRTGDTSSGDRVSSALRMLARVPWFVRNLAVKISMRRRWVRAQRLLRHDGDAHPY